MKYEKDILNLHKEHKDMKWIAFVFLFLNILKITIFNYIMVENQTIISFGYKLLVTTILICMVFTLLSYFKNRAIWYLFYIIQVIYIGGFLCYYDYFNSIFHLFQMSILFPEGAAVVKHFSVPFYVNMLVSILDLPFFIWFMILYHKLSLKEQLNEKRKTIFLGGILFFAVFETIHVVTNTSLYDYSKIYPKKENQLVEKYGTLVNSVYDRLFNANGVGLLSLYDYGNEISNQNAKANPSNVLMIQIESLDANIINKKFNGKLIAPYLSKIANENIYNKRMLSYHLAGGSSDAEYSVINSVEALTAFPSMKLNCDKYQNSIVKQFVAAGYKAEGFHGNIGSFYNRSKAFKLMGFDKFYDINSMKLKEANWGASDEAVFGYAFNIIKNYKQPFFDYIVTMTSHTPFTYVDDYATIHNYDSVTDDGTKQYYKSIHYVDTQLERFIPEVLKEKPNTIIVIYGDHTPGDLKKYEKASYNTGKKYFEFVPLIIITPNNIHYSNSEYAVSFLDVAPTVLEASGIPFKIKSKGVSLLSGEQPENQIPFKGKDYDRNDLINMEAKLK